MINNCNYDEIWIKNVSENELYRHCPKIAFLSLITFDSMIEYSTNVMQSASMQLAVFCTCTACTYNHLCIISAVIQIRAFNEARSITELVQR